MEDISPAYPARTPAIEDPLGHDADTDVVVATTRRGLCRVAFVAAETAVRFQREELKQDPVAWMLAPRRLFDGGAALDACLEREPFRRAVLLHALSLGMDAAPEDIDALKAEGAEVEADGSAGYEGEGGIRLFSAVVWTNAPGRAVHAFHAEFAPDEAAFRELVLAAVPDAGPAFIEVSEGVDISAPRVRALVAPEMLASLLAADARGAGQLGALPAVTVVRRLWIGA